MTKLLWWLSNGWPGVVGDEAYDMYVFANCVQTIPYGSYVLMCQRGKYGATESHLRVHTDYIDQIKSDFHGAGRPSDEQSMARREEFGKLRSDGLRERAPKWW